LLLILIGQGSFKGATMQVKRYDIRSSECLLWKIGQEQLIDYAATFDAHLALRRPLGMGRDDDATPLSG